MSNRQKPAKTTTNLFQATASQKNKHNNYLLALPESKHYRKQLEPLLGAVVNIETDRFTLISDMVDGKPCHRILLENADVVKCPVNRNIKTPVHIQHIWTLVDSDWIDRNKFSQFYRLRIRGFLYLYDHNGEKNIGLQALSIRPVQKNVPDNHNKL